MLLICKDFYINIPIAFRRSGIVVVYNVECENPYYLSDQCSVFVKTEFLYHRATQRFRRVTQRIFNIYI